MRGSSGSNHSHNIRGFNQQQRQQALQSTLIKAIESNCDIDADKLAEALQKPKKTALEILNLRLLRGCIFSLVGIAVCIIGIIAYSMGMEFQTDAVTVPLIFGGISARNRSKLPCGLLRDPQTNQRVNMI